MGRREVLTLLACIAGAFALYGGVLSLTFLSDDHVAIWRTGPGHQAWRPTFFRPLSEATFWAGNLIHGPSAWAHRSFNVVLHGVNAWMTCLLATSLITSEEGPRKALAWSASLLFLVYPFHTESVVWLVGRESSLATAAVLAALLCDIRIAEKGRRSFAVGAFFLLGLLCYESVLVLPVLLVTLRWSRRAPVVDRALWMGCLGSLLMWGMLRTVFAGQLINQYGGGFFEHSTATYLASVPKVLLRSFLPPGAAFHGHPFGPVWPYAAVGIASVVLYLFSRMENVSAGRRRFLALSACWLAALVLAFVAGVSTRTSESDRFLYLPSVFLVLATTELLAQVSFARIRIVFVALLSMACVLLCLRGLDPWKRASVITERIVGGLAEKVQRPMVVVGLPDETDGAFIFRHGFAEALLLNGQDTVDMHIGPLMRGEELRGKHGTAVEVSLEEMPSAGDSAFHVLRVRVQ